MFERTNFSAFVRSVSSRYLARAEEVFDIPELAASRPDVPAPAVAAYSGNSSKIRARQRRLIAIVEIVGGTASRLTFLIMRSKTEAQVNLFQSDLFTMLARDRGESYAVGVIFHSHVPLPQRIIAASPIPRIPPSE